MTVELSPLSGRRGRSAGTRRSWLFVEGANEHALRAAADSGADVLIQELEDFTPPDLRPHARSLCADVVGLWRSRGIVAAVRINPLDGDGREDLVAVMAGAPDIVFLPKTDDPEQVRVLADEIGRLERAFDHEEGTTMIAPNVEGARGLMRTYDICRASNRVTACLVASEDMIADLGAERSRDGSELDYVRRRFHVECVAAGVLSIDCPYTWTDDAGAEADTRKARSLGYRAKSAVHASHAAVINRAMTPGAAELGAARKIVKAFERGQGRGLGRVELDGTLIEVPIYLNARRLLERAAEIDGADQT